MVRTRFSTLRAVTGGSSPTTRTAWGWSVTERRRRPRENGRPAPWCTSGLLHVGRTDDASLRLRRRQSPIHPVSDVQGRGTTPGPQPLRRARCAFLRPDRLLGALPGRYGKSASGRRSNGIRGPVVHRSRAVRGPLDRISRGPIRRHSDCPHPAKALPSPFRGLLAAVCGWLWRLGRIAPLRPRRALRQVRDVGASAGRPRGRMETRVEPQTASVSAQQSRALALPGRCPEARLLASWPQGVGRDWLCDRRQRVLSPPASEAARWSIPDEFLHPTVRNGRVLPDRILSSETIEEWRRSDEPMLLLRIPKGARLPTPVAEYLGSEKGQQARQTYKCRNRNPWYSVPDVRVPAFFLTYMSGVAPSSSASDPSVRP